MTRADLLKAFAFRADGLTYAEIAETLHYDESAVEKALRRTLDRQPYKPAIRYTALAAYVDREHHGSIEVWARAMQVSPHRLRRVLVHGDTPPESMERKIQTATGLKKEEW